MFRQASSIDCQPYTAPSTLLSSFQVPLLYSMILLQLCLLVSPNCSAQHAHAGCVLLTLSPIRLTLVQGGFAAINRKLRREIRLVLEHMSEQFSGDLSELTSQLRDRDAQEPGQKIGFLLYGVIVMIWVCRVIVGYHRSIMGRCKGWHPNYGDTRPGVLASFCVGCLSFVAGYRWKVIGL